MEWIKSSYSANEGECVEVATMPNGTAVRDSKDPSGPVLRFSDDAWRAFIRGAKSVEYDSR